MANPLLSGPFEPLREEFDCPELRFEGEIPAGLAGTLYRIGPNPQFPPLEPYNPLQRDGMIHAFRIAGGRVAYRNRWVRTRQWDLERAAGRALFATADPRGNDPQVAGVESQGAANTHIIAHGGRLLALEEGHAPISVDGESLETLGVFDFDGALPGAMTAHPKGDPATGALLFFANFPGRRFDGALALYEADQAGTLVRSTMVAAPYPALVHDFAVSERHVVLVVCPLTVSVARMRAGGAPIAWEPELGAFLGVLPRAGGEARWVPAPSAMVWHTMNAFEADGRLHVDLCQQAAPAFPDAAGRAAAEGELRQYLTRWSLDLAGDGPVEVRRLAEGVCEYPRIDERRTGLAYRHGFVAAEGGPGTGDLSHRALGRFDHQTGAMALWRAPAGCCVSEPVFVARGAAEGDGWLLATVFDEGAGVSHLAVLDALRIEDGPVARAHLAHRVPAGFHGSWVGA